MAKSPTQTEILSTVQAQSETLEQLSERVVKVEDLAQKQENRNRNLIYTVLFAALFIVVTVAVEVILSTKHDDSSMSNFYDKISTVQTQNSNTQTELEILKAKNPYLK